MSTTNIPPDYHHAIRDPWRYECPECGVTRSRIRTRVGSLSARDFKDDPRAPMYCNGCNTPLYELWDKKENRAVQHASRDEPSGNARNSNGDVSIYDWEK